MAEPPFVVTETFKPAGQFQLYRLDGPARFHCIHCGKEKVTRAVATKGSDWAQLACGGCYSFLVHSQREEAKEAAEAKRRSRQLEQSASTKVKNEQPTGLPFQPITKKERQELFRQLPEVERLPGFFRSAGVPTEFASGGRLWIDGRQTEPLTAMIKELDWNVLIDELVLEYAWGKFTRAVANNARFGEGCRPFLVRHEQGIVFVRDGVRLLLLCATRAQIPRRDVIHANFLTRGPHWDQVADALLGAEQELVAERNQEQKAKVAAEAAKAAAKAEERLATVRWRLQHLPEDPVPRGPLRLSGMRPGASASRGRVAARQVIDRLPDNLAPELLSACLEASRRIRLDRQLDYDRPVILECDVGELTLLPITTTGTRLCVPFSLDKGTETLKGKLVLAASDPLPLLIGEDVAEHDAITVWICALLGFAAATCIEPAEPKARGESARQLRSSSSASRHRLPGRVLARGRQWWPKHLDPVGNWNPYSGSYVPGHRRRLPDGWTAGEEPRGRARQVGITLRGDETWVQPHIRGFPDNIEMRFRWHAPTDWAWAWAGAAKTP